jgi:hypothetical protein
MLLAASTWPCRTRADTVSHFWLSNVDAGPVVPVFYPLPGSINKFPVWARPAANNRLLAFSLDLMTATPSVVALTDVKVLNPLLQETPPLYRHQLAFDSATGLGVTPDLIENFLGFSLLDNALALDDGAGIGPMCGLDPECSTESGAPSWRLATVTYEAGMTLGATELFLAIGEHGLWQSDPDADPLDMPDETSAVFGLADDAVNEWDVDRPTEPLDDDDDHRHLPQGAADAVIQVANADFDKDGDVDGADVLAWQRGLGAGSTHADGDADGDGDVDDADLAAWRFQFGATAAARPSGAAVPAPTGLAAAAALFAIGFLGRRLGRRFT